MTGNDTVAYDSAAASTDTYYDDGGYYEADAEGTEGEEGEGNAWHASLSDLWARLGGYRDLHLARSFDALPERCKTCTDWMTGAAERVRPESGTVPLEPVCSRT